MASSADQPLHSSNPFRRKLGVTNNPSSSPSPAVSVSTTGFDYTHQEHDAAEDLFGNPQSASQPTAPRPPFTTFKSSVPDDNPSFDDDDPVQLRPKKIVKKVRVQSPPPSSPEDSVPVRNYSADNYSDESSDDDDDDNRSDTSRDADNDADPFNSQKPDHVDSGLSSARISGPPANPFARTMQDIDPSSQAHDPLAPNAAKGSMDVDSFKRLLLTGYASLPGPSTGSKAASISGVAAHDGASTTDASSISRQSILDAMQDTPRTSHEISEAEDPINRTATVLSSRLANVQRTSSARQKPPPPSSRHGKLIKVELGADARPSTPTASETVADLTLSPSARGRMAALQTSPPLQSPTSDINKPLPLPPKRSPEDEAVESPFDREAAGKVPEAFAEAQTQPATHHRSGSQSSTQSRRPAAPPVAPPPRRHARTESKVAQSHQTNPEDDPPRSSLESNRSRTDSVRANSGSGGVLNVPAPPPPRRPHHARTSSVYSGQNQAGVISSNSASPSAAEQDRAAVGLGFSSLELAPQTESSSGLATITTSKDGPPKLSPPPPPPARHTSTRRPASAKGIDATGSINVPRKVPKEKEAAMSKPPPPPPRQRGSSRGSMEGPGQTLKTVNADVGKVPEAPSTVPVVPQADEAQGAEILADLDALQREVDALMKQYPKVPDS